jgi:uncharacterized membrane protein YqaE (UPF0057 family)
MDNKLKHMEMIQNVISRMAGNSFLLKGWSVVLVSALFALAAKDANIALVLLAYFPAIIFFILDAYFLWQERLFRGLYDYVRLLPDDKIDFSMNTALVPNNTTSWVDAILSKTILLFHLGIIGSILAVLLIIKAIHQ